MSQRVLAEKTGLSRTAISSYEIGSVVPNDSFIKRIADALDLSVDSLSKPIDEEIIAANSKKEVNLNGHALLYYQIKAGMSHTALAKAIGLSSQHLSNFKKGKQLPDTEQLQSIATVLGCTVDNLSEKISPKDIKEAKESNYTFPFVGGAMCHYRKAAGIIRKSLADKIGVSCCTIMTMENGKSRPTDFQIKQIAAALNCSVKNLSENIPYKRTRNPRNKIVVPPKQRIVVNGSIVSYYRQKAGLKKQRASSEIGISLTYINKIENNLGPVPIDVVQKIADYFNCTISELQGVSNISEAEGSITPNSKNIILSFSSAVKHYRRELLLSQSELASLCGLFEKDIEDFENGILIPSIVYVGRLASIFMCSVDDLMNFDNSVNETI